MHRVIETLADTDSMLELRTGYGLSMITALVRVEGRPLGVVANNPLVNAGAVDATGADKASRFMQLCDNFDIPVLMLCDTPGIMVGPEAEQDAILRRSSRMMVAAANMSVPIFSIIIRRAYGGGAGVMTGGATSAGICSVAWPTGELGGMGIEGHVRLGYKKELESLKDANERQQFFDKKVSELLGLADPIRAAAYAEIDDVIDPADTRAHVVKIIQDIGKSENIISKRRHKFINLW